MKRSLLSLALLSVILLSLTGCGKKRKVQGELILGDTTELSGDWVPYFQNNAADYNIYKLIMGHGTVDMTSGGEYVFDKTVLQKHEAVLNEDGTKTYTFTINKGLTYNDEAKTKITAKDYVAEVLFWNSKVIGDMGAENDAHYYLEGWKDYAQEGVKEFSGVRLLGDYEFSLTIAAESLPYYYELPMVSSSPLNLRFWTDESVTIKDDGAGAYLSENFTKEAFEDKINKTRKAVPQMTSGPYNIESYDEASKTAILKVNKNYKGNYEGQKPSIETLIYKRVTNETSFDELKTGSVDMLLQMASGDEINAGLDLVDLGGFNFNAYERAGYGKLQFACDFGPTQFIEVRQAMAHLLDRNEFARAFTGGHGSVVNGPYGVSMWMYKDSRDELDAKLDVYSYSLEEATKLLVDGGWIYDENGGDYTSGIRHKKVDDGTFMPLIIEWASSEANPVSELLVVKLQENPDVTKVGMKINQTIMSFTEMLNYLYRDGSEDPKYGVPLYGMFNLATGFTPRYDLANTYTTDPKMVEQGYNTNFILDEQLEKLAKDMVKADASEKDLYKKGFVDFVIRWNEILPDLPLYSNIYHDFFADKLKEYNGNALWDMTQAILYAYIEE
ncbi:MAG TPA: ABC transporter substrate-binding protein [Clostridiales bacterium]|nr:ABC transporter substrate-binding protein [Clostridiales bacterium]